jgi:hypothetical protein
VVDLVAILKKSIEENSSNGSAAKPKKKSDHRNGHTHHRKLKKAA